MPATVLRLGLAIPVFGLLLLACRNQDNGKPALTAEQQSFCDDVDAAASALSEGRKAAASRNAADVQSALAKGRTSVTSLSTKAPQFEGASDLVRNLDQDLTDLETLVAGGNLRAVRGDLRNLVNSIEDGLDDLDEAGDCP
jgi:hypothetical protein